MVHDGEPLLELVEMLQDGAGDDEIKRSSVKPAVGGAQRDTIERIERVAGNGGDCGADFPGRLTDRVHKLFVFFSQRRSQRRVQGLFAGGIPLREKLIHTDDLSGARRQKLQGYAKGLPRTHFQDALALELIRREACIAKILVKYVSDILYLLL